MPPPDTTQLPPHPGTVLSEDSLYRYYVSLLADRADGSPFLLPEWLMFLIVLGVILLIYLYQARVEAVAARLKERLLHKKANHLLLKKGPVFTQWLNEYNPYFRSLSNELKTRFLFRTAAFIQSRRFVFHSIKEEEYIPVLVSGAAVQLTFGLKNYLMDFYSTIHIVGGAYQRRHDPNTYFGHVTDKGIHVAWNHFVKGYANYHDSVNVGLHEMAHAVSLDVFLGQSDRHDQYFRKRLEGFTEQGRPVFRALKSGAPHLLSDYATLNFDEFWAVCIETFFENGEELRRLEPGLYLSLCELLNQDPLTPGKIIDPDLAGLDR